MGQRAHISKRLRFEVFKRDEFTCQYCGNHPPEVVLEVDHIKPVAEGGTNDLYNLVTACFGCNRGKADVPLSSVPDSLSAKAADVAEREEQIQGYYEIMQARQERLEEETWKIIHILHPKAKTFRRDWFLSIRKFLEQLDFYTVYNAMENAVAKKPYSERQAFLYFCGTCWRIIKGIHG